MSAEQTSKYSKQIRYPERELTREETDELFSLSEEDITNTLLSKYFAATLKSDKPRFNSYDTVIIPVGMFDNKAPIKTTIGRYLVNMFAIPKKYIKKHGYCNDVLSKSGVGKVESNMATMILDDELSVVEYNEFLNKLEWLSMCVTKYLTPSLSYNFITPIKEVIEKRDKFFAEQGKEIKDGNVTVIENIEKTLVKDAEAYLDKDNDPSYELYKSGVFKIPEYKKTSILGGGFKDLITGNLKLLKSNYMEGVTPEEYVDFSQYTVIGGYSRGISTQEYGTLTKVIGAGMQNTNIDPDPESDCGTKAYIEIELTDKIKSMYRYRYIHENGKDILLTDSNINNYVGRKIKLRSPMTCKGDNICAKCAGQLYYKLNIKYPTLSCIQLSGALLNKALKKFHDTSTKFNHIDYTKYNDEF